MTSPLLMYSTAILDQVNLFLRTLMRILRFLRNTPQKKGNRGPSPTTIDRSQLVTLTWTYIVLLSQH